MEACYQAGHKSRGRRVDGGEFHGLAARRERHLGYPVFRSERDPRRPNCDLHGERRDDDPDKRYPFGGALSAFCRAHFFPLPLRRFLRLRRCFVCCFRSGCNFRLLLLDRHNT